MIKNICILLFLGAFVNTTLAQNKIKIKVISKETKEVIFGANVLLKNTTKGNTTDFDGFTTLNSISNGNKILIISYLGFKTVVKEIVFPRNNSLVIIELHEDEETLETIVIQSTRSK